MLVAALNRKQLSFSGHSRALCDGQEVLAMGHRGNCSPCGSDGGVSLLCTSSVNRGVGMWNGLYERWLLLHGMFTANSYIINIARIFKNNINK